jgi:hypothetical protein
MGDRAKMAPALAFRHAPKHTRVMEHAADDSHLERTFPLQGGLSAALVVGFGAVLAIEGAVLHLWIASRSEVWAWAITALNVATLVWLWREYRAGTRSRLTVGKQHVEIAIGNRIHVRFARSNIASAEPATWRSVPDLPPPEYLNTAKPLEPNVTLVLEEAVETRLSFGLRRRYARIDIRVEDPAVVLAALDVPTASAQSRS